MKKEIIGNELREIILCIYEILDENQHTINDLNVFPVPDGDTGTNMTLTVASAASELRDSKDERADKVADKAASAMLKGARGNSGVILSMMFRGIAKGLRGKKVITAPDLVRAMREGADCAYKAVRKPVDGTILTVNKQASSAAYDALKTTDDIEEILESALTAAKEALKETTGQNPILARAGVVDAGGLGLVYILEAFLDSLRGRRMSGRIREEAGAEAESEVFSRFSDDEINYAYDTVYIMRKLRPERSLKALGNYLDTIGDSIAISEDDEVFKVHVHTNEPGRALSESAAYGVLEQAQIENMISQHDALVDAHETPEKKPIGYVAVCAGDGLVKLFTDLGCDQVVSGGQTMNPSTSDILAAVDRTPADTVFVFPNNTNIILAAEQCDALTEKHVIVIPTVEIPQGIVCMLNKDSDTDPGNLKLIFNEVMGGIHTMLVTYAVRDSRFDGILIHEGEYLAMLDGKLLGSWSDKEGMTAALKAAFDHIEPEFITVYYGEDVSPDEAQALTDELGDEFPDTETSLIYGGQPVYYYIISVE